MFFGEFDYKIDQKGRVPLPPRFAAELKDGIVLIPGAERCIIAYPLSQWEKLAEKLTAGSLNRAKLRRLNRAIFATAFKLNVDQQRRVTLPAPLRQYASIESDVVIAGANNYLEIWDKAQWQEEKAVSQEQAWQIIESLEQQ